MIHQGFFEKFSGNSVYGLHNLQGMGSRTMGLVSGLVLSALDNFNLEITRREGHVALSDLSVDSVLIASQVVESLRSAVSSNTNSFESVVLTGIQIHGGEAYNFIPHSGILRGTIHTFKKAVQKK